MEARGPVSIPDCLAARSPGSAALRWAVVADFPSLMQLEGRLSHSGKRGQSRGRRTLGTSLQPCWHSSSRLAATATQNLMTGEAEQPRKRGGTMLLLYNLDFLQPLSFIQ